MKRKIIQIFPYVYGDSEEGTGSTFFALCNDQTIWRLNHFNKWEFYPTDPIPQDEEENESET